MKSICLSQEEVTQLMSDGRLVIVRAIRARMNRRVADISQAVRFEEAENFRGPCINFFAEFYCGASKIEYVAGDKLALKETFCSDGVDVWYRADNHPELDHGWTPSTQMPLWAVRNFGIIETVNVEKRDDWVWVIEIRKVDK